MSSLHIFSSEHRNSSNSAAATKQQQSPPFLAEGEERKEIDKTTTFEQDNVTRTPHC